MNNNMSISERGRQPLTIMRRFGVTLYGWLGSPVFFHVVVGLFVLQSVWIALSARYPMAFDENFHLGLIQLHAQQWLPFFTHYIPGTEIYGAISRDPSYLYHYLLSWPYRALDLLTDSLTVQVIVLRLINVALFASGFYIFRKLLREIGAPSRYISVIFLFFILIPVLPLLAGQINYDNLVFPLTGLLFLHFVRLVRTMQREQRIDTGELLRFIIYGLVAGLVKYTTTPIFLALVVMVAVVAGRLLYDKKSSWKKLWIAPKRAAFVGYALVLVVVGGFFVERYGINLVRYHSPSPDCGQVLSTEKCLQYGPWGRDYMYDGWNAAPTAGERAHYPVEWFSHMVHETLFTITSWFNPDGTVYYLGAPELPILRYTAWTAIIAGLVAALVFVRRLWGQYYLRLLLGASLFYVLVLFAKNFAMFVHTDVAVAIHGRYLLPVLPVLMLAMVLGIGWLLGRLKLPRTQTAVWLTTIVFVLCLQGGGVITWIMRSNPDWYWQQSTPARPVNTAAKNALQHVVVD